MRCGAVLAITASDANFQESVLSLGDDMVEKPEQTLIINHVLYLTPEQRMGLLQDKTPAQVVGVNVPVWFNQGKSSEPAQEVFCQYTVTNEPQDMVVATLPTGYRINLPQTKPSTEEEARMLDVKKLGNSEQGGSGWFMFKQFQTVKQENRALQILHYIELRDLEYFLDSINLKDSNVETTPSAC